MPGQARRIGPMSLGVGRGPHQTGAISVEEATVAQKIALCIGINAYPGTSNDLSGRANDAHDWGAALKARGFTVTTLLDAAATGQAMRDGMARVIEQAKPGDSVVIQYSGHGSYVPDEDGDEP